MRKRLILVSAVIVALLGTSGIAFASIPGPHGWFFQVENNANDVVVAYAICGK
jgi:hypothetical protein